MKNFDHRWNRLVTLARQAPEDRDAAAPYGFPTRVAARALAAAPSPWVLFERVTLRALLVASLLMVASLAAHLALPGGGDEDDAVSVIDPVADILDVS
jgi:hypothetical protein